MNVTVSLVEKEASFLPVLNQKLDLVFLSQISVGKHYTRQFVSVLNQMKVPEKFLSGVSIKGFLDY